VSRSEAVALSVFSAALLIVFSLRWLLPLDETVYQWLQFHRTCALESSVRWIDPVVRGILLTLIACALAAGGWRQPWLLLGLVLLFLAGSGAVELLKTAVERLRPNSTPAMISGNSFPSGHTTGTTMAALIGVVLIHRGNWRPWQRWAGYTLAAACVAAQAIARLLTGSHWLSDVIASVLLGTGWILGAGWLRRLPRSVMAAGLTVACLAFFLFDDVPGLRLRLPSALDERRSSLASVEFGTSEAHALLEGEWADGPPEPIGPVAWAMSREVGVRFRDASDDLALLKVALRPATGPRGERGCAHVVIAVNEWVAPEICLTRGWREYHLEPPSGVLRRGENTVRFQIVVDRVLTQDDGGGFAAFRYLRLYPKA